MVERARFASCPWRPVPTISTRSAPRCSAGDTGAIWRIEPSPKYSRCTFIAGKMKGRRGEERRLELERHRRPDALVSLPALEAASALEERHALPRRIARRGHAGGVERARVDVGLDALE